MHRLSVPFLRARKLQDSSQQRHDLITESPEAEDDWKDPFYDDDSDVIAIFLLDHEILDRKSQLFYHYMSLFAITVTSAVCLLYFALPNYMLAFFVLYLGAILLIVFPILILEERRERNRRERTHIALTKRGIYVDESDAPGSKVLRQRTIYGFNEIRSCSVERTEPFGLIIFQVIAKNLKRKPILRIDGVLGAHKFVEMINNSLAKENRELPDECSVPTVSVV